MKIVSMSIFKWLCLKEDDVFKNNFAMREIMTPNFVLKALSLWAKLSVHQINKSHPFIAHNKL